MKAKDTKKYTIDVNGLDVTVEVTASATYDPSYGADADGNRGVGMWEIEDLMYEIPETSDNGTFLTEEEKKDLQGYVEDSVSDDDSFDFYSSGNSEH